MIKNDEFKLSRMKFIHKNDEIYKEHLYSSIKWLLVYSAVFNLIGPDKMKVIATGLALPILIALLYIFYIIMRGKIVGVSFYYTDYTNDDGIINVLRKSFDSIERTNKPNVYKIYSSIKMDGRKNVKVCKKEDLKNE